ncbi:MAG: hypothetical protein MJZ28_08425 [Paludibacteraceae bacterium]|nr:hypothetical protein [Paludibacteraceae bacterium]
MNTFFKDSLLKKLKQGLLVFFIARVLSLLHQFGIFLSQRVRVAWDDSLNAATSQYMLITSVINIVVASITCYLIYKAYLNVNKLLVLKTEENCDQFIRSLTILFLFMGGTTLFLILFRNLMSALFLTASFNF